MRKLFFGLIFIISATIFWINFKLYSGNFTKNEKQKDIILQLNFLEKELKINNLGNRMQDIFPEGFVFTNALYGLSWCELAGNDPNLKAKAINEALFAYNEINSAKAKSIFDSDLTPTNGIYYIGWKNYLLSKILKTDTTFADFGKYKTTFIQNCNLINQALQQSNSPYLQSYHNQSWPADMFVAMASIKNHDQIFEPKYQAELNEWIQNVKTKLDPKTKMIPHKVKSSNGNTLEGARGSSISLIIRLLAEIDLDFAKQQFELYQTNFVDTTLGLPSINEYPKGQSGKGDIDSGPVILGVGFAGTIVSIGTFSILDKPELAEQQYKTINAFGLETKSFIEKKYVFGLMPIADLFITWGRTTQLKQTNSKPISILWRVKFHLISLLFLIILWSLFFLKRISKFLIKNRQSQQP